MKLDMDHNPSAEGLLLSEFVPRRGFEPPLPSISGYRGVIDRVPACSPAWFTFPTYFRAAS